MRSTVSPLLALLAPALYGCAPKEEDGPAVAISTEVLDFGEVALGDAAEHTITLDNAGGGSVEVLSVSLIEGEASVFDVTRDPVDSLGAGESLTVTVTFRPAEERVYDGRLQVRSDDPSNPNLYVTLTGTGSPSTADDDGDGTSPATGDCNDGDATVHPGAPEVCDGRDNDCNGVTPADEADADYDGWLVCEGDCNDAADTIYPGAPEVCDDADSDCDGHEADRADEDDDGYTICDGDCADAEPAAHPGGVEACDTLDNDCSGVADDIDEDHDGHSPCGAAGDCDDTNPAAFPIVVDATASGGGDGTEDHPYLTVEDALAHLDTVCHTIQIRPGAYTVGQTWSSGALLLGGTGTDPAVIVLRPPKGVRVFDVSGGAQLTLANLTLEGATTNGDGGSLRAVDGTLVLEGVIVRDNTCTGDGGAIAVSSGGLTIRDSLFMSNVAEDDGGALSILSGTFTDTGTLYTGNEAVRGGAMLLEAAQVTLSDVEISGNTARDDGGGMEILGGGGITIQRVTITTNAAGGTGGGISIVDLADATSVLRNLIIQDNTAASGGGISATGSVASVLLVNNTIVSNEATGQGSGVYLDATDTRGLSLWSNIVAWNSGGSGVWSSGGGVSVAYTMSYASTSGTELTLGSGEDAGDNLTENPEFRAFSNDGDPTNDDLDLSGGSPAVNSGPADGEGPAGYTVWSDSDGSRNDRGHTGGPGGGS